MAVLDRFEVRLFGRPAVRTETGWSEPPSGKATAIGLYLAFHGGWVGRGDLVYLFWPDTPEPHARGNLRPLLSRLGREPYARELERQRERVRWPVRTDVQAFHEALAAQRWGEAWDLAREDLLAGFTLPAAPEFEAWLEAERAELRAVARSAGLRAIEEASGRGDHAATVDIATLLHHADPLDEIAARAYIAALARAGARATAIGVFERHRQALERELELEPEAETLELVDAITPDPVPDDRRRSRAAHAVPPRRRGGTALPLQPTRFVGRSAEIAVVAERLLEAHSRIVTIVGPGGVGKTRLAIEAAARLEVRFRDGARFVDLAPAATPIAASSAVARALELEGGGAETSPQVIARHLREGEMLLVLDNLEHLVADAAEIVRCIVAEAAGVTMLATSRVRLALQGERIVDLGGLSLRRSAEGDDASEAATFFVRAGRRVRPDFLAEPADLEHIEAICALVGGLPLALEIAATWLRVLGLQEIRAELGTGLGLLDEGRRGPPHRHESMRSVFAHSWALLDEAARRALRALSVFRGGWTREAAWAVTDTTLRDLSILCDASLVGRDTSGRFVSHPVVGQYAREHADASPEERDAYARRHARYYLRLLAERQFAWRRLDGARLLGGIDAELANVEAAWRWAIAGRDLAALGESLNGLRWALYTSDRLALLEELVTEALPLAEPDDLFRGRALVCLGAIRACGYVTGGRDDGWSKLEEGLALVEAHGSGADSALAWRLLGVGRGRQGRVEEARDAFERARRLYASLADGEGVAMMLNNLADTAPTVDEAIAGHRAAIAVAEAAGEAHPAAMASDGLGLTLLRRYGASQEAREALERAVEIHERTGFRHNADRIRLGLSDLQIAAGDVAEARATIDALQERIAASRGDRAERILALAEATSAWIAFLSDDHDRAEAACRRLLATHAGTTLAADAAVLVRTVAGRLAVARADPEAAEREFAAARAVLDASAQRSKGPGTWHDHRARVPEALPRVRLLVGEVDLALAARRLDAAEELARRALTIALHGDQEPVGALAGVAAARVLDARGDHGAAEQVAAFVRSHAATPFEARHALARRVGAHEPPVGSESPAPQRLADMSAFLTDLLPRI
jgi:predicted ATPase/DNA-binding SARP family transcriptional activator